MGLQTACFFGAIPNLTRALILLIIGWMVAGIFGKLVTSICKRVHVDMAGDRVGVNGAPVVDTLLAGLAAAISLALRLAFGSADERPRRSSRSAGWGSSKRP